MQNYLKWVFLLSFISVKAFALVPFTLESSAFKLNSVIPDLYTCNGSDQSPPLSWSNAPAKTQSFAIVVKDPEAENGEWTHWVLFNIPPTLSNLDAGAPLPEGATAGKNSWKTTNYRGPCPPVGMMHRYEFKLYALDKVLDLGNDSSTDQILDAMTGHVLATAVFVGLYQKLRPITP